MHYFVLIPALFLMMGLPLISTSIDSNPWAAQRVVRTYPASQNKLLEYQIFLETDTADSVRICVAISRSRQRLNHVKLDWSARNIDSYAEFDPSGSGIMESAGFSVGRENSQVYYCPKTVQLENDIRALLITQIAGFEHIKRRHDLFIIRFFGSET